MTADQLPSAERAASEKKSMVEGGPADPPQPMVSSEKITEWLIAESRDVGNQVAHLSLMGERILSAFVALIALTATVAIANDKPYLIMGLPILLTIVLGFVLVTQSDLVGLATYKARLEVEINKRCGLPVTQWESRVVANGHSRIQTRIGWMLTALTLAIGSTAAMYAAFQTTNRGSWGHEHSGFYLVATSLSIGVEVLTLTTLVYANHRTRGTVSELIGKSFDEPAAVPVTGA